MHIRKINSISRIMFTIMIFISTLSIIVVGFLWGVSEYGKFEKESEHLKKEYIERQKHLIKTEVQRAVEQVNYTKNQTEIRLKESIRNRVHEAHAIAMNLYSQFHESRTDAELKRMIVEALRNIRFNDGRGYYFAVDFNGIERLFADHPELEGKDLSDMRDSTGKYVIRDLIEIAKSSGEGYYRYLWTKPDSEGSDHLKIAYVKHFKPFNWFIGTGEYDEDVQDELQNEILQRLIKTRFGIDGYLFGSTYDGDALFTNGKITKGTNNIWDATDPNGIKIIQEQRKAVLNEEGDFYRYSWKKLNSAVPSPKLSFSMGIAEWNWMIGAGVYMDEIDQAISLKREILNNQIRNQFIKLIAILLVIFLGTFLVTLYISSKTHQTFSRFLHFFEKASSDYVQIDSSGMIFSEFKQIADSTNKLIKDREESKKDLSESEERWRSLTETSPDHILTLDADLNIQFANFASPGLTVKELSGTPLYQYIEGKEKQDEVKVILESVLQTGKQKSYETEYPIPDGGTIYYESTVVQRMMERSKDIVGLTVSSRNITERKQSEDKLLKNQYYLTKAQEIGLIGTWELDIRKNILKWTDENYKIFGVPLGTEMNYEIFLNCIHPDDRDYVNEKWSAGLNKDPYDVEHRLIVDDNVKWVREKADIEFDTEGNPLIAIGFTQDITERKQAEEQIKASLKEKETLLQEIHHRVKNNMQIITSLLKLQMNKEEDQGIKNILRENQGRVYAMSAIHESLYQSEDLSEIDFKSYLSKLTQMLLQTYSIEPEKISYKIESPAIKLKINVANPLSLVLNELISNSLKYAFPDGNKGEIIIKLQELSDKEVELTIKDDGIGIPDELDWKNSKTLGLKLVRTLVENQLDGSIDMESKNGTKFIIKFNIET